MDRILPDRQRLSRLWTSWIGRISTIFLALSVLKPAVQLLRGAINVVNEVQTGIEIGSALKVAALWAYNIVPNWLNTLVMVSSALLVWNSLRTPKKEAASSESRSVPAEEPTLSSISVAQSVEQSDKPNLVCARTAIRRIHDPTDSSRECVALIATFHNSPLADRTVTDASNVIASIAYQYDPRSHAEQMAALDKYLKGRNRRHASLDTSWTKFADSLAALWIDGSWTGKRIEFFGLNSANELILAIRDSHGKFCALEDLASEREVSRLRKVPLDKLGVDQVVRAEVKLTINGRADPLPYPFILVLKEPDSPVCRYLHRRLTDLTPLQQ